MARYPAALQDATVFDVGLGACAVEPLAGRRWVACAEAAALHALVGGTVPLPSPAHGLRAVDSTRLLVAHRDDAAISVVDGGSEHLEATVPVAEYPQGIVVI